MIAMLVWNLKAMIVNIETDYFMGILMRKYSWRSLKEWMLPRKIACL
jgi:hypothetical protein